MANREKFYARHALGVVGKNIPNAIKASYPSFGSMSDQQAGQVLPIPTNLHTFFKSIERRKFTQKKKSRVFHNKIFSQIWQLNITIQSNSIITPIKPGIFRQLTLVGK